MSKMLYYQSHVFKNPVLSEKNTTKDRQIKNLILSNSIFHEGILIFPQGIKMIT